MRTYQFYSPLATTVKAVYAQEGDLVHSGKLILTLDDVAARAQVASAESAVKTAQAALDAAMHNGTQAEQQASAAEMEQDRLARDQAQHDLDALTKLAATGAAAPGEVAAARERLETAQASLNAAQQSAQHRYSPGEIARAQAALNDAEAALAEARHIEAQTAYYAPVTGTIYTMDAAPSEFAETGKLLVEMADLHQERVRAYFDEPDLGRLATGQAVSIRWDAKPNREWHGHVARLPVTVVTYTTRNVGEVLVDLDGHGRRPAARYQRDCDRDHLERAECAEHAARGPARTERKILCLQSRRQRVATGRGHHRSSEHDPGADSVGPSGR